MARFAILLIAALWLFASACSDSPFPAGLPDDRYDLKAMALQAADLPEGYESQQSEMFDNETLAEIFGDPDPEAKKRQFDAQGRIRSYIEFYTWVEGPEAHLGRPISFTTWSTLYRDTSSAAESMKSTCGVPIRDDAPIDGLIVPKIGDQGTGFVVVEDRDQIGKLVETNVCFRTGRLVHAITQNGLDGTQDIGLSVRLAERMLDRVKGAFARKEPVEAKTEEG